MVSTGLIDYFKWFNVHVICNQFMKAKEPENICTFSGTDQLRVFPNVSDPFFHFTMKLSTFGHISLVLSSSYPFFFGISGPHLFPAESHGRLAMEF